jgi:hypothetical protein
MLFQEGRLLAAYNAVPAVEKEDFHDQSPTHRFGHLQRKTCSHMSALLASQLEVGKVRQGEIFVVRQVLTGEEASDGKAQRLSANF